MTPSNRSKLLRRIINPRNLLIGIGLLIIISPCLGDANVSTFTIYYDTSGAYSPTNVDWATVHDYSGAIGNIGGTIRADLYCGSTSNKYGRIYRNIQEFNTSTLPDDAVIESVIFSIKPEALSNSMIDAPYYSICQFTPPGAYGTWETDFWYYLNYGDSLGNISYSSLSLGTYYNITLDESVNINLTGISCFGGRIKWDNDNSAPTWGSSDFVGVNLYDASSKLYISYWSESEGNPDPDAYNIELTASGTFCYGHAISFNLSETLTQEYGMYDLSLYLNGDPSYKYYATDIDNGPLLYSHVLEPGNWSVQGWWIGDDSSLNTWLNFTIDSNCTPATFSGTFNSSVNPWNVTSYDFNFNPDFGVANWTTPGLNDTLFYQLWQEGIINDTQWNEYVSYYNAYSNYTANLSNSNSSNIIIIDDFEEVVAYLKEGSNTAEANLNTSHSILLEHITPIIPIIGYGFDMVPPAILDLITALLAINLAMIIIWGRK